MKKAAALLFALCLLCFQVCAGSAEEDGFLIIRDGKLHCKILFRSNDACKATFMNAFALILLQKRIADTLGAEMGAYTHRANSFHCYARDFAMLDGYCARIRRGDVEDCESDELTFSYAEDWAEQMLDAQADIAEKVAALKLGGSDR